MSSDDYKNSNSVESNKSLKIDNIIKNEIAN